MKITTKTIPLNEYCSETRYFAETDDGFDGTAQGYGYKSIEKLHKAYWYYQNRDKIRKKEQEAKEWLTKNRPIRLLIKNYFSVDNLLYAAKCGEELTFSSFIKELKRDPENDETVRELMKVKHLWRNLVEFS